MSGDVFITQSLAQMSRDALSHASCVHEHQRGLVLANQGGDPVVNLFPDLVGHHRFQR